MGMQVKQERLGLEGVYIGWRGTRDQRDPHSSAHPPTRPTMELWVGVSGTQTPR